MSEVAENVVTDQSANADAEAVPGSEAESAPAGEIVAKPVTPEEKAKNQERFDKLTRERYQALSRAEQTERQLQEARAELERLKGQAKPQQVAPAKFPTLAEYGYDEEKHAEAVQSYLKTQTPSTLDEDALIEKAVRKLSEKQTAETRQQTWKQREADFAKSKPDFVERVYRQPAEGGPRITDSMLEVILESDLGPAVAYHLAENVEVSEAIARLPPMAQARELGRIEARLEAAAKAPPPPPVSQAPPPVSGIQAAEGIAAKPAWNDPKLSFEDFKKQREAYMAKSTRFK